MNQAKQKKADQFLYLDRWVDKEFFRAFVYDKDGNQKLANSYDEFQSLMDSGVWFASKPEIVQKQRKNKHDTSATDS